jgi:hypothetical protein
MKHFTLLPIICLAVACGGSDLLPPTPETLQGQWAALDEVPGSGESWDLTVQGSAISGTGTWSGEACCAGTLSLTGTIAGDSIHLDLIVVTTSSASPRDPFHKHFDGALTARNVLRGTVKYDDGTSGVERFQRQ